MAWQARRSVSSASGRGDPSSTSDVRLSYAQGGDGRLLHVSQVPSGLACGCACPGCGAPVVARKGDNRAAHFGHRSGAAGQTCAGAYETMLHRLAKQVIADQGALGLPSVVAAHGERRRLLRPAVVFRPDAVVVEAAMDGMRPDILARKGGHELLVEVAVTHFCGPAKVALIREGGLAAVEIDLSKLPHDPAPEDIEAAVLRTAPRAWLYNRLAEAATEQMRLAAERQEQARQHRREQALNGLVRALEQVASAPAAAPAPAWMLTRVQEAGLGGIVGLAFAGGGCFRVTAEHWQSASLLRFVVDRTAAFGEEEIDTFLRQSRMLRPSFEALPYGFTWAEVGARSPGLLRPVAVVAEYLRALGAMGLVRHGRGGLWQPSKRVPVPSLGDTLRAAQDSL